MMHGAMPLAQIRKGGEDLMEGWGVGEAGQGRGGGWEVGRWDFWERAGDSGQGPGAPGLARGPAVHHAAP